jgi:predicted amidohydrolase
MNRVAVVQMYSSNNVQKNLALIEKGVAEAASQQATIVMFPENVVLMGDLPTDKLTVAEAPGNGPIQQFLSGLAKKYNIWLVGGTIPITSESEKHVYASCWVWDNQGQVRGRYDKIHLFDVQVQPGVEEYLESNTLMAGREAICVDSPIGRLGLSVCYDLRFPELYRNLLSQGAEILVVSSAFTAFTGKAHWESLLRARAIENFCYVIAPNQAGVHSNGRATYGHSMIIDPWGEIIACLPKNEGVIVADINHEYLIDIRQRFPVSNHRRIYA